MESHLIGFLFLFFLTNFQKICFTSRWKLLQVEQSSTLRLFKVKDAVTARGQYSDPVVLLAGGYHEENEGQSTRREKTEWRKEGKISRCPSAGGRPRGRWEVRGSGPKEERGASGWLREPTAYSTCPRKQPPPNAFGKYTHAVFIQIEKLHIL